MYRKIYLRYTERRNDAYSLLLFFEFLLRDDGRGFEEELGSGFDKGLNRGSGVSDEVGETDAAVGVAEEG